MYLSAESRLKQILIGDSCQPHSLKEEVENWFQVLWCQHYLILLSASHLICCFLNGSVTLHGVKKVAACGLSLEPISSVIRTHWIMPTWVAGYSLLHPGLGAPLSSSVSPLPRECKSGEMQGSSQTLPPTAAQGPN